MFAISFAATLAAGKHPSAFLFHQRKMREHLHTCLSNNEWSMFSTTRSEGRENKSRVKAVKEIELFCDCRMPASFADMVECSRCQQWYHMKICVVVEDVDSNWYCRYCSCYSS